MTSGFEEQGGAQSGRTTGTPPAQTGIDSREYRGEINKDITETADNKEEENRDKGDKAESENTQTPEKTDIPESTENPDKTETPEEAESSEKTEALKAQEKAGLAEGRNAAASERPGKKRHHRGVLLLFLAVLAVAGCLYYYGVQYSQTHFLSNTVINGHDVSGMTAEQVKKILAQKAREYTFTLTFRDGSQETMKGASFDFEATPDDSVDRILDAQDNYHWYRSFQESSESTVDVRTDYDEAKLTALIEKLPELQEDRMTKPADAYITYDEDSGQYTIVPETEGSYVNEDTVIAAAQDAVAQEKSSLDVEAVKGAYDVPQIRSDDKDLISKKDRYNKLIAGSMTWDLPDGEKITVDGKTTREWLSEDDDGDLYRDDDVWNEKITACVDDMASKVDSVGTSRSFDSTSAGTITVSGGDYGYCVNKSEEVEEVTKTLEEGETIERSPVCYSEEFSGGSKINDGIGDTYIEADLSSQHVWIYIDGSMVCDTPCVSGNTSLGRGTPTGIFQILYKDTNVDLKGQKLKNGKYSYVSHVNYWMPFYGGCGFHDASWRSSFGGTIYRSSGSHGCVNLPSGIASTFYSYVQPGMPVVVYY